MRISMIRGIENVKEREIEIMNTNFNNSGNSNKYMRNDLQKYHK
jgi:hypothetical protein